MQIPLQVTFEGSDPSEPVRVAIEREVERLIVTSLDATLL